MTLKLEQSLDEYLLLAENDIKNFISQITFLLDNYLPKKQLLGYENDFEFIRGWTMGQIQASCIDLFRENFGRIPSKDEYSKIIQLIIKRNYDIQKKLKSYYSTRITNSIP